MNSRRKRLFRVEMACTVTPTGLEMGVFQNHRQECDLSIKDVKTQVDQLNSLRKVSGTPLTTGISDKDIEAFLAEDEHLAKAISAAHASYESLPPQEKELIKKDEKDLCDEVQSHLVNFYPGEGINPYVPLAAKGPWIVTTHGAVIHDSGGYGMLGLGHNPDAILESMGEDMVMANVMTPSLAQKRLSDRLLVEIGHTRGICPMPRFICLNSGSEAVALTSRIVDIHAHAHTQPGADKSGRTIKTLAVQGGFHGRTDRPARLSQSTRAVYKKHLASFRHEKSSVFVDLNDLDDLRAAFDMAEKEGIFFQAFYMEPVMGEGVPGVGVTREYYDLARKLTREHGSLLVMDSIQAALRAQGCLSIVDYPGFEDCDAPDMETFSKALNAGQYPLSVVAMREEVAEIYVTGVYGNTMTTNPKALTVACHVLDAIDDPMRQHIRRAGAEFKSRLETLAEKYSGIQQVDGTGLMLCAHLDPKRYTVNGAGGFEEYLRFHGIEMIHGGDNGLRFTPHFAITDQEIDLIIRTIEKGLKELVS